MTEKAFDIRDEIIKRLREDIEFERTEAKYAAGTAFLFGVLVGVIASGFLIYGF